MPMTVPCRTRRINDAGLALIKQFEGLRLLTYSCAAGCLTIGYGHTGPDVAAGMRITQEEAERLLQSDLRRFERAVADAITAPINDNQFSACVAIAFNIGAAAFTGSTLVKKINAGDMAGATAQFARWNLVRGVPAAGLTSRRLAEAALFKKTEDKS